MLKEYKFCSSALFWMPVNVMMLRSIFLKTLSIYNLVGSQNSRSGKAYIPSPVSTIVWLYIPANFQEHLR